MKLPEDDVFIKISFRLTIGDLIDSTIMQLLPVPFAKEMVHSLMGESEQLGADGSRIRNRSDLLHHRATTPASVCTASNRLAA